jgi:predicted metal-dependent peptidase
MAELLSLLSPLFELLHDHTMSSVFVRFTGLGYGDLVGQVINNHVERFEEAMIFHEDQVKLRG